MKLLVLVYLSLACFIANEVEADQTHHGESSESVFHDLTAENVLELIGAETTPVGHEHMEKMFQHIGREASVAENLEETHSVFLTPDLLIEEFGEGGQLTHSQFNQTLPVIIYCLVNTECELLTTSDEAHDDHEDQEDHDNHEDQEDHDNHEDHEDHDNHEDQEDHINHDSHDNHDDHDDHEEGDDDVFEVKIIALILLFIESLAGSLIPFTFGTFKGLKSMLSVLNCFAGGAFLATGVIHLIPHVVEYQDEVDNIGEYPLGMVLICVSFCIVFYIEHIVFDAHSHLPDPAQPSSSIVADKSEGLKEGMSRLKHSMILLAATSVHSVLEALVLGLENDVSTAWILFAIIAGHKGVTAMALSSRFSKSDTTPVQGFLFCLFFSVTAPIAILIGTALSDVPNTIHLILTSMSTGTFLYIGAYEVISEEFQNAKKQRDVIIGFSGEKSVKNLKFIGILLGVAVISGAAFIPHPDHEHEH